MKRSIERRDWANKWLDSVADGSLTMSQRKLTVIEGHGGIETVRNAAMNRGIHLVLLTDDKGNELIAASKHLFTVIC